MKRTYIKPTVEILGLETKATFMIDSWNVRDENGKIYDPNTDHGYIIEGKDKDDYGEGEYDPWDPTKW